MEGVEVCEPGGSVAVIHQNVEELMMEKKWEIFTKIAYKCFYIGIIIETIMVVVDKSVITNPIEGRLFQLTFILFFLKVCLTKYSWKEYFVIAMFLGLGAISYFVTGRNEIIRVVMFVAACKDVDMQRCLKLVFYLTLFGCVIIIGLSQFGIGGAAFLTQDYGRGNVETRYTFGMGHPNALQCMIWAMTVLGVYLYGEKMKWYGYLLMLGVNVFFFFLTDSKTSLLVAIFTILYAGIYRFNKKKAVKRICSLFGILTVLASVSVSIFIAGNAHVVYNYDWGIDNSALAVFLKTLDSILTGRIRSLTGNVRWEGTVQTWKLFSEAANNYYFDMGWIRLFYWYGIIPAIIAIFVLLALMFYCVKQENYMAFVMAVSFSVYTLVEAHAVSVYIARNYVFFLLGAFWCQMLDWKEANGRK